MHLLEQCVGGKVERVHRPRHRTSRKTSLIDSPPGERVRSTVSRETVPAVSQREALGSSTS